ncbi:MAG: mannose-6-phosphate isomerase, class I [Bacteroidota bacterium]
MSDKNSLFRLTGKVQHYQWGGFEYIPALLGIDNNKHQPFAEYWLGAHENAPAQLANGENLDQFIKENPGYLGEATKKIFGRLPYLLKILDVKDMLSIQVHPNKKAAVLEFAHENKKGTPLNAPDRNYKDDNHKPELMTALSEFWLLHGFQNPEALIKTIKAVPEFDFMVAIFEKDNYKKLYELVMTMDQSKVNAILQPLLDRIIPLYKADNLQKDGPDFWAARAALTFNEGDKIDRGIFSIYLFNVVHLKEGQAVFQDAGILHAYLEGQNVEIMANSDNVLRGGLTPKHIDVKELMKHVLFEPVTPNIILGESLNDTERVFKTPAPDFELSKIVLGANQTYHLNIHSADIFLVLNGAVEAVSGLNTQRFKHGEAFIAVNGSEIILKSITHAEIYRASVPATRYQLAQS